MTDSMKNLICGLWIFCIPFTAYALEQHEKLWLGSNYQTHFGTHHQLLAFVFTQLRFINQPHPIQTGLLEGGLGYRLASKTSIWAGYRWSGQNPYHRFYQENLLFQQVLIPLHHNLDRSILRSRLEEISRTNQTTMLIKLRERAAFEFSPVLTSLIHPFTYDEVFFNLNKTNYSTHKLIAENRVFIGINWSVNKTNWWEIGYINQYIFASTTQSQNQMNHIVSITYNYT